MTSPADGADDTRESTPDGTGGGTDGTAESGAGEDAGDGDGTGDGTRERVDPAAAFGALSDPLRVDILRELAAHRRENEPGRDPIGFADLRRCVDVRDSGRFRYHLNELRDHFVEKSEGGYRLTHAGTAVVAAVLAGTITDASTTGRAELDSACHECGEPAVAAVEEGVCAVPCPNDHRLFQWPVPPNVTADASVAETVDRAELLATQAIERVLAGICHTCYDPIEPEVRVDEEDPRLRAVCDTCGGRLHGPSGFCLLVDPEVAAFYREHGRRLRDSHVWEHSFVRDEAVTVEGTDPVRVALDVTLDDDRMRATLDGTGSVVGTDR